MDLSAGEQGAALARGNRLSSPVLSSTCFGSSKPLEVSFGILYIISWHSCKEPEVVASFRTKNQCCARYFSKVY